MDTVTDWWWTHTKSKISMASIYELNKIFPACFPGFILTSIFDFSIIRILINWLTDSQTDERTYVLYGRMRWFSLVADALTDWLTDWLIDWLTDWLIDLLIDWLTGKLTRWCTDCIRESAVECSAVHCRTVQCSVGQWSAVQYSTVQCSAMDVMISCPILDNR